jgi:hypothetical protein
MRRQIDLTLSHLRRRDLYHALDLTRDAPAAEIIDRADALRRRWMQKAQVTADKTAWLEAVTFAQAHLTTPEARARYDRTLRLEAEESFQTLVEFAVEGLSRLDPTTSSALSREAERLGVAAERADRMIRHVCRRQNLTTAAPTGTSGAGASARPLRVLRCRSCGGVSPVDPQQSNDASRALCPHCGASFRWKCPGCGLAHWNDQTRCACGFLLEQVEPFERRVAAAREHYRQRDYPGALAELEALERVCPQHPVVNRARTRIDGRMAELARVRGTFEVETNRHCLMAVRRILQAWSKLVPAADPEYLAALTETHRLLGEAASLAAEARRLAGTQPDRAQVLYRQSLAIAADLPDARDGLAACPPPPPTDLRLQVDRGGVRLQWVASPPDAWARSAIGSIASWDRFPVIPPMVCLWLRLPCPSG